MTLSRRSFFTGLAAAIAAPAVVKAESLMPVKVWQPSWRIVSVDWRLDDAGLQSVEQVIAGSPQPIIEKVSRFKTFEDALEIAKTYALDFAKREGVAHQLVERDDCTIRVGGRALKAAEAKRARKNANRLRTRR